MEIIWKEESFAIMGACFEAYNTMGPGFLEQVYQECLEIELGLRGIPFRAKPPLVLTYKDRVLKKTYEPDVTCFEKAEKLTTNRTNRTNEDRTVDHRTIVRTCECNSLVG